MTIYSLNPQSIKKIINPFDTCSISLLSGQSVEAFTADDVKNIQRKMGNYSEFKTDRELAAFYSSSYPVNALIELSFDPTSSCIHCNNKESFLLLWAACYRQVPQVRISFDGDIGIFHDSQARQINPAILKPDHIDWGKSFQYQWTNWHDKDFILAFIEKTSLSNDKVFANIPGTLLEDEDFLVELGQKGFTQCIIDKKPEKLMRYTQLFKDNPEILLTLWENYLMNDYMLAQQDINEVIHKEKIKALKETTKLSRNNPYTDYINVDFLADEHQRRKEHLQAQEIKQLCDQYIFNNAQACEYFFTNSHQLDLLAKLFSATAKNQPHIYDLLLDKSKTLRFSEALRLIPEDFYYHPDGRADYLKRNILLLSAMENPAQYSWVSKLKWMKEDTAQSLVEYLAYSHKKHVDGASAYRHLIPKACRNDEKIIHCLLSLDTRLYSALSPELKVAPSILSAYIEKDGNIALIPKEEVFKQSDEKLIMKILDSLPNLLMDKACPPSWRLNPQFLKKSNITSLNLTPDELKEVFSDEELGCELIEHKPYLYTTLPQEIKERQRFALTYLEKQLYSINIDEVLESIAPFLWSRDDFCLKALSITEEAAICVPKFLWNDVSFLSRVFTKMDNEEISSDLLEIVPGVIKEFFETFDITQGYAQFFENYLLQQELEKGLSSSSKRDKKNKI